MRPKIGYSYILQVDTDLYDEPITWAMGNRAAKYITLGELDGMTVTVSSMSKILASYCLVSLNSLPNHKFYVSSKMLKETDEQPIFSDCSCDIYVLCNRGCQCGAMDQERSTY